eukprot:GHRR01005258.1.p3 GENE.GHRR01005258.1~~GHRR01005258.1.p3  ORF type:complete len:108 (+),score=18.13 GHRR01005258.1:1363-1686(+)
MFCYCQMLLWLTSHMPTGTVLQTVSATCALYVGRHACWHMVALSSMFWFEPFWRPNLRSLCRKYAVCAASTIHLMTCNCLPLAYARMFCKLLQLAAAPAVCNQLFAV